jgi:hypothetical protein
LLLLLLLPLPPQHNSWQGTLLQAWLWCRRMWLLLLLLLLLQGARWRQLQQLQLQLLLLKELNL